MSKLPIPADAIAQHTIVLGKTGSGKSSKLRVMVEYLLAKRRPVTIIDPKGDWWGLKAETDGKKPGFDVLIFGGSHADIPIDRRSGAHVAEFLASTGASAIIDLGGWMPGERTEFFIDFAAATFRHPGAAHHLVIDEVHNFAPQGKVLDPNAGKALHWGNRLASEGRGKGITLLSASQRPQKVHKDFVTSNETLVACRVIHPLDRKAIKEWMDGFDPAKGSEVLASLAQMQRSEAWVWSPEIGFGPKHIDWPMFTTYDSFSPQNAKAKITVALASFDLVKVKEKFGRLIEEAAANDPVVLKKRIRELEAGAKKPTFDDGARAVATKAQIKAARREGYDSAVLQFTQLFDTYTEELRGAVSDAQTARLATAQAMILRDAFDGAKKPKLPSFNSIVPNEMQVLESPRAGISKIQSRNDAIDGQPGVRKPLLAVSASAPRATPSGNGALPIGESAVLRALIQYSDGLDRSQITILTGYKRSTRNAYIQRLAEKGYANTDGDHVFVTPHGREAMPDAEPLPTGQALRDFWQRKLPEGEWKVLERLIVAYPDGLNRDDITELTGYKRSTRNAYIQRLAAKELVSGNDPVKASDVLF